MTGTGGDLSDGKISDPQTFSIDADLLDQKQNRSFRAVIFWAFGSLSLAMLIGLFCELTRLLAFDQLVINSSNQDWHSSLLLVAILIIFASVPLSIVISLMRMTSAQKPAKEDEPIITSPQIELIKNISSLVTAAKS